jgi:hypothetical protein
MVQTKDQYVLVHRAVKELFEEQLRIIDSHPYANVDHNGLPLDIKSDLEEPTYETVEFHSNEANQDNSNIVPPILPPANRGIKPINPKLEKQVENRCLQHEQELQNATVESRGLSSNNRSSDEIEAASNECEEKVEKEKDFPVEKRSSPTSKVSPIRNALLRKPSIVKLKAFFEKSKDEKKSGSTQLSRAKSDVSSRFYSFNSFASSFGSRGDSSAKSSDSKVVPSSSGSPPGPSLSFRNETNLTPPEKPKLKPALFAKPTIAVKRSKSLKLRRSESTEKLNSTSAFRDDYDQVILEGSSKDSKNDVSSSKPTSAFSIITPNAMKVCVKQVDIPMLQQAISKSVKPESQTARTYDTRKPERETSDEAKYPIFKKPAVPPKTHLSKDNAVHVKSVSPRIKMGVAKEMEDALQARNQSFNNVKLKKYDTVTPKSFVAATSGTALTRSQSHVWQPSKIQLPIRIFSDENIYQQESVNPKNSNHTQQSDTSTAYDDRYGESRNPANSKDYHQRSSSLESSNSYSAKHSSGGMEFPSENPVVRKRVPKTNPYTNYSPSNGNSRHSPVISSKDSTDHGDRIGPSPIISDNGPKDLPLLKLSLNGNRSRENSSESSSNTGTPRNSLPGTPTRTIDSSYTQILKTNLHDLATSNAVSGRLVGNGYVPPRSILKGSLSSTPSESDERLDAGRSGPTLQSNPVVNKIIVTGVPPKISSVRIAVGVRERRNSFRQAVWKEEQSSHNTHDVQESPSNVLIFASSGGSGSGRNFPQTIIPTESSKSSSNLRSHRDYEPIWPEHREKPASRSLHTNNTNLYGSSNETRLAASHIPVSISRSYNPTVVNSDLSRSDETSRIQPEFKNRFDEINNLLEELKAPSPSSIQKSSPSTNYSTEPHSSSAEGAGSKADKRDAMSAHSTTTNLKHNRSLRTQRPQYQPGLSCFAFRKPSSFESITDQLHAEEYHAHNPVAAAAMASFRLPIERSERPGDAEEPRIGDTSHAQGRRNNDYVSLRQCHAGPNYSDQLSSSRNIPKLGFTSVSDTHPIPPPRTKNKRLHGSKKVVYSNAEDFRHVQNGHSSESPSDRGENGFNSGEIDSINLPEIVRCSNYSSEDNQPSNSVPSSINPTSPKSIFRALGLVQAKAANMRSRFAHWTEAKDRNLSAKRSEPLLSTESDSKEFANAEGGMRRLIEHNHYWHIIIEVTHSYMFLKCTLLNT